MDNLNVFARKQFDRYAKPTNLRIKWPRFMQLNKTQLLFKYTKDAFSNDNMQLTNTAMVIRIAGRVHMNPGWQDIPEQALEVRHELSLCSVVHYLEEAE